MFVPDHFAVDDADALIARLARRFAGILISVDADGQLVATHAPLLWDRERRVVTAHIARANPHWKLGDGRGLIVLPGAEAYVSPSFYPSKAEHGKTVPTWNYEAIHFSGMLRWFDDRDRLERAVRDLSNAHEHERAEPWTIEDAPRPYIDALLRGIVGVEMQVERVEAKRKFSQNKSASDFAGVIAGLEAEPHPSAKEVGALMRDARAAADDPDGN